MSSWVIEEWNGPRIKSHLLLLVNLWVVKITNHKTMTKLGHLYLWVEMGEWKKWKWDGDSFFLWSSCLHFYSREHHYTFFFIMLEKICFILFWAEFFFSSCLIWHGSLEERPYNVFSLYLVDADFWCRSLAYESEWNVLLILQCGEKAKFLVAKCTRLWSWEYENNLTRVTTIWQNSKW